jgi:hypothetical protein
LTEYSKGSIILNPAGKHQSSLIWLHGMDASPEGFAALFLDNENPIRVPDGCRVILPSAPD